MQVERILFATDFTEPVAAVEFTARLAKANNAEAIFANVRRSFWKNWLSSGLRDRQAADRLQNWADRASARGVRAHPAPILDGNVAEALAACADDAGADLIVVGQGAKSSVQRMALGSTAESVTRFARQPVWVWHSGKPEVRKILCGFDGSQASVSALKQAAAFAERFCATLTLVSVLDDPTPHLLGSSLEQIESETQLRKAGRIAELNRCVDALELGEIVADRRYLYGRPDEVLTALAQDEQFDLIVLGRTGRGWARRWLFASVMQRVLHGAPCSVLITEKAEPHV